MQTLKIDKKRAKDLNLSSQGQNIWATPLCSLDPAKGALAFTKIQIKVL